MCSPSSKKLCGACDICNKRSFASHPKAAFWSNKNVKRPEEVHLQSNKKFIFDCEECGHELTLMLNNINSGQWCSYCNKDKLCDAEDCLFCYAKSFASQSMASQWSVKNEIIARMVCKGSEQKFWFDCTACNHSFQTVLYTIKKETYCPYCTHQRLCEEECKYCFEKSCASHIMSEAWSSKNDLQPRQVFLQSNKKMIFDCLICSHEYTTTVTSYYNSNHGSCLYCANQKLCDQECDICFNKSFASHPKVNCWSSKNTKQPREVFKGSEQRGIFNCDKCASEFDAKVYNILTGYWCPYCKNKSEAKMLGFLSKYPECRKQLRFEWCKFSKTGHIMPFDFGINKVLIELDGEQHFIQISNWDTPENVQTKDKEKIQKCMEQGYSIIHISQLDVWYDKYDWKTVIQEEITLLQDQPPTCVFISSQDIYGNHCIGIENCKMRNPLKKPEI